MINDNKITIVFPMAGDGIRFGSGYKPFHKIDEEYFIMAAVRPFLKWNDIIEKYIFIIRRDHEDKYKISKKLKDIFQKIDFEIIILDGSTSGPVETVSIAMSKFNMRDQVMICDCDQSINIDPMFKDILSSDDIFDAMLPTWEINENEASSWSIVTLDKYMEIVDINEKLIPKDSYGKHLGIIGCYYFSNFKKTIIQYNDASVENFSEIIKKMISSAKNIKLCKINEAEFFGDPVRLNRVINLRKGCDHGRD